MCAWRVAEKKKQRDGMGEEDGRRKDLNLLVRRVMENSRIR